MNALANSDNPWLGLASYGEGDSSFFFGRSHETRELLRLVEDEMFVLLYGISGLGKTSLLQAAVVPELRENNFLPIVIRLAHGDTAISLSSGPLAALREAAGASSQTSSQTDTLWEYLHHNRHQFWSARQNPLIPVLIFDQFEEIFAAGRATEERRVKSEEFLKELSDLIHNRPPVKFQQRVENNETNSDDYNFDPVPVRILVSLREDFLPQLSEYRQRGFPTLLRAAIRLRPLSLQAARECIERPAPELLEPGVAERLVTFLAGAGETASHASELALENGQQTDGSGIVAAVDKGKHIESALLSVVCRELNNERQRRGLSTIDDSLLRLSQEQILTDFYERSFQGINPALRDFVERELVSPGGYRDSRALDDALSRLGIERSEIDQLIDRRLLHYHDREDGQRRIELTHDVLTGIAGRSRDFRRARESEELRRQAEARELMTRRQLHRTHLLLVGMGVLLVCAIVACVWALRAQYDSNQSRKRLVTFNEQLKAKTNMAIEAEAKAKESAAEAERNRLEAEKSRNEAYKLLATQSFQLWESGQLPEARKILDNVAFVGDPLLSSEARQWEWRLADGLCNMTADEDFRALTGHTNTVNAIVQIPGRQRTTFISASSDGTIRAWDASSGKELKEYVGRRELIGLGFTATRRTNEKAFFVSRVFETGPAGRDGHLKRNDRIIGIVNPDGSVQEAESLTPEQLDKKLNPDAGEKVQIQIENQNNHYRENLLLTSEKFIAEVKHRSPVRRLAISPGLHRLVSIDDEGQVIIWNLETGEPTNAVYAGTVRDMAFSRDGQSLALLFSGEKKLIFAKLEGLLTPKNVPEEKEPMVAFAFGSDNRVAIATEDGVIHFWNYQKGTRLGEITPNDHPSIAALGFSPDGKTLAVSSGFKVLLYETEDTKKPPKVLSDNSYHSQFTFHQTGRYLVTAGAEGLLKVWDLVSTHAVVTLHGHTSPVACVAFFDDNTLASGGLDSTIRLWNLKKKQPAKDRRFQIDSSDSSAICFSSDQRWVAIANYWGKRIEILNAITGKQLRIIPGQVFRTAFLPFQPFVAVPDDHFNIQLVDVRTGVPEPNRPLFQKHQAVIRGIAFSSDGKSMVSGDESGKVYLWDVSNGSCFQLPSGEEMVKSVAISPDGKWVAASSAAEGKIRVYNAAAKDLAFEINQATDGFCLQFSPDSKALVTDDFSGRVHLRYLDSAQPERTFLGHTGLVWGATFSPNCRRLVTSSDDKTLRLWDVDRGTEILTLDAKRSYTWAAFSPDGVRLAAIENDRIVFFDAALFATDQTIKDAFFFAIRGGYQSNLENWPKAIADLTQAINLGETDSAAFRNRGYANAALGDFRGAERDFEKALQGDPDDDVSLQHLASVEYKLGKIAEYQANAAKAAAMAKHGNEDRWPNTAAWLYAVIPDFFGNVEPLVDLMNETIQKFPDNYADRSTFGSILYRAGKYEEASST
jgi:WD40 repeat protein